MHLLTSFSPRQATFGPLSNVLSIFSDSVAGADVRLFLAYSCIFMSIKVSQPIIFLSIENRNGLNLLTKYKNAPPETIDSEGKLDSTLCFYPFERFVDIIGVKKFSDHGIEVWGCLPTPGAQWAWLFKALEQLGSNLKFKGEILYEGRHT